MTPKFLLQATKVLHTQYDDMELDLITNFILGVDEETLDEFNSTCTFTSYDCDLDLYIEIINVLIKIFEETEFYEVCEMLKNKKDDAIIIKDKKTI